MEHIKISWEQIEEDCEVLAGKITYNFPSWLIVARGGLIPAALLLKRKTKPFMPMLHISGYKNITIPTGRDFLVVDDVVDTGDTVRFIKRAFTDCFVAVLYAKPMGKSSADVFVREYPHGVWLDFPWEDAISRD